MEKKAKSSSSSESRKAFLRELDSGAYEAVAYVDGEEFSLGGYLDEGHARLACAWADLKMFGDVTSSTTIAEKTVQEFYTTEQVLRLMRDDWYHRELELFKRRNAVELFRKTLTASDVRGSNGLHINKKDADQHFARRRLSGLEFRDWEDEVWFLDYDVSEDGRGFISTASWKQFVIGKNLEMGDEVVFFHCSGRNRNGICGPYRMLCVVKSENKRLCH